MRVYEISLTTGMQSWALIVLADDILTAMDKLKKEVKGDYRVVSVLDIAKSPAIHKIIQ